MLLPTTRIYVQLGFDDALIKDFHAIGQNLPAQKLGRLLPDSEFHITVIHFGKAPDVLASLRQVITISDKDYEHYLEEYIAGTSRLLTDESFQLSPIGYDRFGARETTLVARYTAPPALHEVHAEAYAELLRFFAACGVDDPQMFAEKDFNFQHAGSLTPHVTIYKGYDGPDPVSALPDITAHFMKLVY